MPERHTSITALLRYPVKSMLGESLESAEITELGIAGDRIFAVRDEVRGGIRGGKKIPSPMTLAAKTDPDNPTRAMITTPDGDSRGTDEPDINPWLSQALDHEVTLWPLLPPDQLEHYLRGAPDHEDFEQELRGIFGREPDEPLPDLSLFAEVIEYESPPGTYFDAFPLHIMSQQSLDTLTATRPGHRYDVRRFRPNILVDMPSADPYPEQAWVGKSVQFGDCVIDIVGACPRCSMTTHGFDDLPRDTGIMRNLVQAADGNLGVYGRVRQAGSVERGAAITLLD